MNAKCKLIKFLLLKSYDINTPCAFHASHSTMSWRLSCVCCNLMNSNRVCVERLLLVLLFSFHHFSCHKTTTKGGKRAREGRNKIQGRTNNARIFSSFIFFSASMKHELARAFREKGGMMKVSENDPYTLNGHEHRRCRHFHRWLCCVINSAVGLSRLD